MRNYYIIGSQHGAGKNKWTKVFPMMRAAKAVDVGYARNLDLSQLYGKPEEEIYAYLKKKDEDPRAANSHKLFLNLRPGDLVAIKKFAAPQGKTARLRIYGYAVVKARNGIVYHYEKGQLLPHQINVDFRLCDEEREFQIGSYGTTISRLKNPQHIAEIFQPILEKFSDADQAELQNRKEIERKEQVLRGLGGYTYEVHQTVTVTAKHKKLQKRLYDQLVSEHGVECVLIEKDWVDLQVRTKKEITLYEIKPFDCALLCLREALGQIMLYAWKQSVTGKEKLKLVIAGPCKMTKDEENFLRYLKTVFDDRLEYLAIK